MTGKVTDEMLMAFVDGETDEATRTTIERALAADAALAARAQMFRDSRSMVRDAFADTQREPVPRRLVESALGGTGTGTVVPLRRSPAARFALPLAACVALTLGVAGYLAGQAGTGAGTGDLLGAAVIAEALSATRAGEHRTVAFGSREARLETLATYRVEGGVCRSFDLADPQTPLSGVGCDRGHGWAVELTVARAGGTDTYAPASGPALQSIDAYLDALDASEPLSAREEADLPASRSGN